MPPSPFNPRRRRFPAGALFSMLLAAVLIIAAILLRAPLANVLWRVLAPVSMFRQSLQATEVSELQAELASTTAALADRNALYQENQLLKNELGRSAPQTVLAGVLLQPPQTPYDTLMLDAGSENGVAQGDTVYAGGTLAIGTITDVYDTTARVTLFSAPGETYQGFLNNSAEVSMVGQGAGSLTGEVPAGTPVAIGDSITAPGVNGGYLGSVTNIDAAPGASFETIYTHLPIDLFSLQFVEIAINP